MSKRDTGVAAFVTLAAIVVLGAALRAYRLTMWPDAINQDEVILGDNAFALARTGADLYGHRWPLLLESFGDWTTALSTYLTVPFVFVGGVSQLTTRLPACVENTAFIVVAFALARRLFASPIAGVAAALVAALAPWDVELSQWAAEPAPVPLLAALALLTGLVAFRAGRVRAVAFGALCGLLVYAYTPEKLYGPLLVVAGLVALPRRAAPWVVLGALVALPMELVSFLDPHAASRFNEVGLDLHDPRALLQIVPRYLEYYDPSFLFARGDTPFPTVLAPFVDLGAAWLLAAAVKAGGLAGLARRPALFVLLALLAAPIPASLTQDHFHVPRMTHALPIVAVLAGGGVAAIWSLLRVRALRAAGAVAFAVVLGWQSATYYRSYYELDHLQRMHGRQYALGAALLATIRAAAGRPVVVDTTIGVGWNQPFAYDLFFTQRDPRTLPLAQMRAAGSLPWSYVTAIDNLRFVPIEDRAAVEAAPAIAVLPAAVPYAVHELDGTWYLYEPHYVAPI